MTADPWNVALFPSCLKVNGILTDLVVSFIVRSKYPKKLLPSFSILVVFIFKSGYFATLKKSSFSFKCLFLRLLSVSIVVASTLALKLELAKLLGSNFKVPEKPLNFPSTVEPNILSLKDTLALVGFQFWALTPSDKFTNKKTIKILFIVFDVKIYMKSQSWESVIYIANDYFVRRARLLFYHWYIP